MSYKETFNSSSPQDPEHPITIKSQPEVVETPRVATHCLAVELEEVPDIDELDASSNSDALGLEFELGGILLDNSQFNSDENDDKGWIKEVSAEEWLNDCFYAEVVERAQTVTEEDMDCFEAFNYKVDTNLGDNTYHKLPQGLRHLKDTILSIDVLQHQISQLSGVRPKQYDCCINSCCCYTRQFTKLLYCPFCWEPRYTCDKKPVKTFNYFPLIL
ncbi:hypothetical protein FRC00_001865 [Tulasnella sp. 408]|nr:hypothetical protein FRC00_001865 [Tulasnella sp. 408]